MDDLNALLAPMAAFFIVGLLWSLGIRLLALVTAGKAKNDEKPKRDQDPRVELGDDGELTESITLSGMTLDQLIQQYDRREDE